MCLNLALFQADILKGQYFCWIFFLAASEIQDVPWLPMLTLLQDTLTIS